MLSRLFVTFTAMLVAGMPAAADQLLFDQPWTSTFAAPESVLVPSIGKDVEVSDDFELVGSVGRLLVTGNASLSCPTAQVSGVYVRFWSWTPTGPGAPL